MYKAKENREWENRERFAASVSDSSLFSSMVRKVCRKIICKKAILEDCGNVMLTSLFIIVGLSFLLALTISFASVYVAWTRVDNGLELAKESIMGSSFQMKIKSVENPSNVIAQRIAENFRGAGYSQKLSIWCYEEPDYQLNDNVRAIAIYAIAEYPYALSSLSQTINISCDTSASLVPYSDKRVFKLQIDSPRVYTYLYDEGATNARTWFTTLDNAPSGLSEARKKALEVASTY